MSFLDNPSNDIRDQKALDTMQTWCELIIQQKVKEKQEEKNIAEKATDHRTHAPEFLDSFKLTYKKSTIPFNNTPHSPDFSDFPPQPQHETYSCELCGNDAHFGYNMVECLGLADLGASINLMPLSVWKKLSLPDLTSIRMTLELADRTITRPKGVTEDVFVKVGKFHYPANFVVVDFDADPRVPLILGRPFLRTAHDDYYDTEGDILYLEKLLNEDPSPTLPPMKNDDFKQVDVTLTKPSIEEPPELELKDLPSHLEYEFLEGTDKLPVIISKELKDEEKTFPSKNFRSHHKRAIAWKISDIKGIDPSFCTHKILMEDDFKPAVQHQRRVNPKIYEVIKKEVIKLLDVGLIYPISDSPWVSPVHCVPKKGASDYARWHLGQRNDQNSFQLTLSSKTMTDAQAHYTTTKKELLAFVYAFEKFRPYLVLSKTIVYTDHSALKYLLAKQDAKPRLLWWILLLQEFDVIICDKKGAKNLAADHLSRLENSHEGDLEKTKINETFPLETLGITSSHNDSSTLWFADIANYHAENFVVKGMSSQ
ncbi:reverse transcriptase domain-containing protein [Tanacetum coccineum]